MHPDGDTALPGAAGSLGRHPPRHGEIRIQRNTLHTDRGQTVAACQLSLTLTDASQEIGPSRSAYSIKNNLRTDPYFVDSIGRNSVGRVDLLTLCGRR